MFFQWAYAGPVKLRETKTAVFAFLDAVFQMLRICSSTHPEKNQIDAWCSFQYFLIIKDLIRARIPLRSQQRHCMVIDWHRV